MGCNASTPDAQPSTRTEESGPYVEEESRKKIKEVNSVTLPVMKQPSFNDETLEMMVPTDKLVIEMQKSLILTDDERADHQCFYCTGSGKIPKVIEIEIPKVNEVDDIDIIAGAEEMKSDKEESKKVEDIDVVCEEKTKSDKEETKSGAEGGKEETGADNIDKVGVEEKKIESESKVDSEVSKHTIGAKDGEIKDVEGKTTTSDESESNLSRTNVNVGIVDVDCWVCDGTGSTPALLNKLNIETLEEGEDTDAPDCLVCYEKAHYGLSTKCLHFYCVDCIKGSLEAMMDTGQFPAFCPACRVKGGENPDTGLIEGKALSFLQSRGVITKEFLFRFMKQQMSKTEREMYFSYPSKCGNYIKNEKEPEYEVNNWKVTVKTDKCPCGANVCIVCHQLVNAKEVKGGHVCDENLVKRVAVDDIRTMALLQELGKPCPNCGFIVSKNEGCDYMICGTHAHGKLADAIRNGGCGHQFLWSSLKPVRSHYYNLKGERVNGNATDDYPGGVPGWVRKPGMTTMTAKIGRR